MLTLLLLSSALLVLTGVAGIDPGVEEDMHLDTPGLIKKYGYPVEIHSVTTEDGYILTLQRIPHGKTGKSNGIPVLLQHGLMCNSVDWVVTGYGNLAYLLADEGYDVWLGNGRGTEYSRGHVTLSPTSAAYWDFSWHEMGMYDVPAVIDYMLNITGQQKISYIGHSMGTTMFYVMGSLRPEYNEKIRVMLSMAPIAYMSHLTSPFTKFSSYFNMPSELISNLLGVHELTPSSELMSLLGRYTCEETAISQSLCTNILFLTVGYDSDQMNLTQLPAVVAHVGGSSTRQLYHYSQEVVSGKFRQYDYRLLNYGKYHQLTPPDYLLSNVKAPVFLYYSDNDWMSAPADVERLKNELGNCVGMYKVPYEKFNHMDYMLAMDAKTLVYDKALEILSGY